MYLPRPSLAHHLPVQADWYYRQNNVLYSLQIPLLIRLLIESLLRNKYTMLTYKKKTNYNCCHGLGKWLCSFSSVNDSTSRWSSYQVHLQFTSDDDPPTLFKPSTHNRSLPNCLLTTLVLHQVVAFQSQFLLMLITYLLVSLVNSLTWLDAVHTA